MAGSDRGRRRKGCPATRRKIAPAAVYRPAILFASFRPRGNPYGTLAAIACRRQSVGGVGMHLDVQTLSVVTVFITALLGALLVFAGLQNRSIRAPMWWGAAHIVNAGGLGLLTSRGAAPGFRDHRSRQCAGAARLRTDLDAARAFSTAARSGRFLVLLAPAIWLLLCRIPVFADNAGAQDHLRLDACWRCSRCWRREEFWRGRDEPLMSRWPSVIVLLALCRGAAGARAGDAAQCRASAAIRC